MEMVATDGTPTAAVEVNPNGSAGVADGTARAHVRERGQRGNVDRGGVHGDH
jgi:hypothetical protein